MYGLDQFGNSFWAITVPLGISLLLSLYLIFACLRNHVPKNLAARWLRRPTTRYFGYLIVFGLAGLLSSMLETHFRALNQLGVANELHPLAKFFMAWHFYCYPAWLSVTRFPPQQRGKSVRPVLAGLVWFLFVGLQSVPYLIHTATFYESDTVFLWLLGLSQLTFYCVCLLVFLAEALHALPQETRKLGIPFTYRCVTLLGLATIELLLHLCFVVHLGAYKLPFLQPLVPLAVEISNAPVGMIYLALLLSGDGVFLHLSRKLATTYQERRYRKYLPVLLPVSRRAMLFFPAAYRVDPGMLSHLGVKRSLDITLLNLTEIRAWIWEAEHQCSGMYQSPVPLEHEARIWAKFLKDRSSAQFVLECRELPSPAQAIPPLPGSQQETLDYFLHLTQQITRLLIAV